MVYDYKPKIKNHEEDNKDSFCRHICGSSSIWCLYKSKADTMSDLMLANIEALAQSESGGYYCCSPYSYECYRILGGGIVYGLRLPLPC